MFEGWKCMFGRHRPDRRHAKHDGRDFRTHCKWCSAPMIRNSKTASWEVASEGDYDHRLHQLPPGAK